METYAHVPMSTRVSVAHAHNRAVEVTVAVVNRRNGNNECKILIFKCNQVNTKKIGKKEKKIVKMITSSRERQRQ